jgi:hypothetical protein
MEGDMRSRFVLHATFPITKDTEGMLKNEIVKAMEDFSPCPLVATLVFYDGDGVHKSTTLINTCYGENNDQIHKSNNDL